MSLNRTRRDGLGIVRRGSLCPPDDVLFANRPANKNSHEHYLTSCFRGGFPLDPARRLGGPRPVLAPTSTRGGIDSGRAPVARRIPQRFAQPALYSAPQPRDCRSQSQHSVPRGLRVGREREEAHALRRSKPGAVFHRLDANPGATQGHSNHPPVSPLRKGGKDGTPRTFRLSRRRFSPLAAGVSRITPRAQAGHHFPPLAKGG